jgi:hypothetical protein
MPIQVTCPNCARRYALADTAAGKTLRCKGCGNSFKAAGPDDPDREEDAAETAPQKKARPAKSGGRVWLWVLLGGGAGAGVLLLVCGGLGVFFLLLNRSPKVPRENFARVTKGVSEAEVVALMGSPGHGVSTYVRHFITDGAFAADLKIKSWNGPNGEEYLVQFLDDRVVGYVGVERDGRFIGLTPGFIDGDPHPNSKPLRNPHPRESAAPGVPGFALPDPNLTTVRLGQTPREVTFLAGAPDFDEELSLAAVRKLGLKDGEYKREDGTPRPVRRLTYEFPGKAPVVLFFVEDRLVKVTGNS